MSRAGAPLARPRAAARRQRERWFGTPRRSSRPLRPPATGRGKTTVRANFPAWRARLVLAVLAAAFLALAVRAVYLQGYNQQWLAERGQSRFERIWPIPASRGAIVDREGEILALSMPVRSVWALARASDGTPLEPAADELAAVAPLVGLRVPELRRRLYPNGQDSERDRVMLNRHVDLDRAQKLRELKLAWLAQNDAYRRVYPNGEVLAHVLGFTDVDDRGQEGIELVHDEKLKGVEGARRVRRDARGQVIESPDVLRPAREGAQVKLSIDARVQHLAFRALRQAVGEYKAQGGGIVVIDVASGELLALANFPSYDPNQRDRLNPAQMRNRVVTDIFEPGSTLKPFTAALALELGKVTPATVVNTAPGSLTVHGATIRDLHAYGALTVAEVIQKSSNVGSAKIALEHLDPSSMWHLYTGVGFGRAPKLGFPGEALGQVRPYKNWRPIEQATMSYGHGIALSLVQVARAYSIFARDGDLVPLTLVRRDESPEVQRVISPATAKAVRAMLESVVSNKGTAPRAQISGYRAGGKTGTARKLEGGVYSTEKHIVSFVGFAPISAPRLIVAVMIDDPHGRELTGGRVAAPVFSQVMGGALRLLRVPYDAPLDPVRLPPVEEELAEST